MGLKNDFVMASEKAGVVYRGHVLQGVDNSVSTINLTISQFTSQDACG